MEWVCSEACIYYFKLIPLHIVGILTILLQSPRKLIEPHLDTITAIVSALCNITAGNDGHLPSSLPTHIGQRRYVQICHGTPGLLILLSTMRLRFAHIWNQEWEKAETLASEAIWKEGLITKGLGVCHGVSGNAWPWLLQAKVRQGYGFYDEIYALIIHDPSAGKKRTKRFPGL